MSTTYDVDGTYTIASGDTIVVTHDSGSGSDTPVVTLDYLSVGGTLTVDATNGADAVIQNISEAGLLTLNADGGTIDVVPGITAGDTITATVSHGGSLIIGGGVNASDLLNVDFASPGQLELQPGINQYDSLTINAFSIGDSVVVDGLAMGTPGWTSYQVTTTPAAGGTTDDTITFYNASDAEIATLTLNGVPQGETITAQADGTDATIIECVCFLAGTHIATAGGERPVEDLVAGDLVRTASGETARVKWVGRRTIDTAALRHPELAMPVRITADAIADGVPRRDLRVTPEHALLVEGHLIPARLLVNGSTVRLDSVDSYTFYHVELEQHDILLAEGLGAESYLDTGNRGLFADAGVVDLFVSETTGHASDHASACMPLTLDPALTGAVWQSIAARAARLGHPVSLPATTHEPELALLVGDRRLRPVSADRRRAVFALPAGTTAVILASRASMPWSLRPWLDDRRRLGLAIDRIVLRCGDHVREVALDSPALGGGWWTAEQADTRGFRWTDGAARIALPPSEGPTLLEIGLHAVAAHAVTAPGSVDCAPVALAS